MKARCSICRRRCRGSPSPKRRSFCKRRIASSSPSPRFSPPMARPGAPRPQPIQRRSKCPRPSSVEAEGAMAAGRDNRLSHRGNGHGAAISRRVERLDHADQKQDRYARDRHQNADRRQDIRPRSHANGRSRASGRDGTETNPRHFERIRRARHRRLLPRHRSGSRGLGALWPDDRRRAGGHRERRSAARP